LYTENGRLSIRHKISLTYRDGSTGACVVVM
jgi:hypothetical protein